MCARASLPRVGWILILVVGHRVVLFIPFLTHSLVHAFIQIIAKLSFKKLFQYESPRFLKHLSSVHYVVDAFCPRRGQLILLIVVSVSIFSAGHWVLFVMATWYIFVHFSCEALQCLSLQVVERFAMEEGASQCRGLCLLFCPPQVCHSPCRAEKAVSVQEREEKGGWLSAPMSPPDPPPHLPLRTKDNRNPTPCPPSPPPPVLCVLTV